MRTSSEEKYLEEIYKAVNQRGYARVSDVAQSLDVSVSSVSKMVRKLAGYQLVEHERYQYIKMTEKGILVGKQLVLKHQILATFFQMIGLEKEEVEEEVNKIEHYISWSTIGKIHDFILRNE
ncbi:iron dependent repressor, metal binding and dimerization domain protein [Bacillus songklensis]|uniref:Manganese transport regulator n=1 Tax=Bacillus songklensis TaxID=1069116 RepID=A0ABV8AX12_9BACI